MFKINYTTKEDQIGNQKFDILYTYILYIQNLNKTLVYL